MYSRPRFNRGTSVIAALVFAALLGAVALGLHAFQSGSTNTAGLSAQAATPVEQSDETCVDGEDFNYTVQQQQTGYTDTGSGSYSVTGSQNTLNAPAVVATCPTDQQALNKAQTSPGVYLYNGTYVNLPAQITLPPASTRNSSSCSNGKASPQPTDASLCTYTKQTNNTYKLNNWKCRVSFYNPNTGVTQADSCWIKDVPVGGSVNGTTPTQPPSQGSAAGSGTPPTVTPNAGLCGNGATNPPTCDACPTGTAGVTDDGQTICQTTSAQTTQPQPPAACSNGATDSPTCITCPAGTLMQASSCQAPTVSNPAQSSTVPGQEFCGNGAMNPPNCDACPSGTSLDSNNICQTPNALKSPSPGPANNTAAPNNTNPLGGALNQAKSSTFSAPQQTQTAAQQNNCNIISSILGGCSGSGLSCQLTISPNPPQQGMPANLTWTSSGNVYSGTISGVGNISGPSGSYTVYPTPGAVYTMTVTGQNNSGTAQCSTNVNSTAQTGCTGTNSCTSAQTPYGVGTNGQACSQPPAQPAASSCTTGSWQPVSAANNGCITSYQCGGQAAGAPTAQLSCSPQVADVGMSVAISYSCANATGSSGAGFTTGNQTSGSTTTVITKPPSGTNTANFGLTCTNGAQASGAQCSVQINQAAIVLVANPQAVPSGQTSSIGWVTAGMQACVISSPDDSTFTSANASNQSINGVAQTDAITQDTEFDLTCTTLGGLTKLASTTVSVAAATSTTQ